MVDKTMFLMIIFVFTTLSTQFSCVKRGPMPKFTPLQHDKVSIGLWESFEDEGGFKWEKADWDTRAEDVERVKKNASEGEHSLKLSFSGVGAGGGEDAVFTAILGGQDFSDVKVLSFDVFGEFVGEVNLSVAIVTGANSKWYETDSYTINPDWNLSLAVDLQAATFKAEEDWDSYTFSITSIKDVRKMHIKLVGPSTPVTGAIYLDNIVTHDEPKNEDLVSRPEEKPRDKNLVMEKVELTTLAVKVTENLGARLHYKATTPVNVSVLLQNPEGWHICGFLPKLKLDPRDQLADISFTVTDKDKKCGGKSNNRVYINQVDDNGEFVLSGTEKNTLESNEMVTVDTVDGMRDVLSHPR